MRYRSDTTKCRTSVPGEKDSGFTLVETLIALTLVSLIGIPVFMVFSDTITFTAKVKDFTHWNRELIQLERALRKSVGEVQIPFWISDIEITEGTGIMTVPYWNGDVNSVFEITIENTILIISTAETDTIFKGYDEMDFDLLKDSGSRTIGLSIKVKKIKRENVEFQCAFGALGREVLNER